MQKVKWDFINTYDLVNEQQQVIPKEAFGYIK